MQGSRMSIGEFGHLCHSAFRLSPASISEDTLRATAKFSQPIGRRVEPSSEPELDEVWTSATLEEPRERVGRAVSFPALRDQARRLAEIHRRVLGGFSEPRVRVQGSARQASGSAPCLQQYQYFQPVGGFLRRSAETEEGGSWPFPAMETCFWAASGSASV